MCAKRLHGGSSPRKVEKYKSHFWQLDAKKAQKKKKWLTNREKWKNNEEYQKIQRERAIRLKKI